MKNVKALAMSLVLVLSVAAFAGCAKKETATPAPAPAAVAAASLEIKDDAVLEKSIGNDGKWIVCTVKDITTTKNLVMEGDLKNGKKDDKGVELLQRKLALYAQDADKKVTARYKLTAPKLTVKSANARIQGGTFVGDVYVEVKDFELNDAKIEGNIYFASEEIKNSFKITQGKDAAFKAEVTGKQEVKK
jgi:hypothetical protein